MKRFAAAIILAGLGLILSPGAQATPVVYGDFAGANVTFQMVMENGSPAPAFGPPVISGDMLSFSPLDFSSFASNGSAETVTSTLTSVLSANPGNFLEKLTIVETGSYELTGQGGAETSANINGTLILPGVFFGMLDVSPKSTYSLVSDTQGNWTSSIEVDFTGMQLTQVMMSLQNNLQTTSALGTSAFIQKNSIQITHTPEPSSLILGGIGLLGLAVYGRNRRNS